MPIVSEKATSHIALTVADFDTDTFHVVRYRGTEGICRLYRFGIEAASRDTEIPFDGIVGKAAVLKVDTPGGERWFHGIVGRLEVTGESVEETHFRIELVPTVWLLSHRYGSRIFQNKSVVDIVTDVLESAGIGADRYRFDLQGKYVSREYCVQYRETDFNFICRLMEEEGIRWSFEQSKDGHVFVMADAAVYEPIDGDSVIRYASISGLNASEEHVYRFRLGQGVRPGSVVLNDFNFENPTLDLNSRAELGRDVGLEVRDYPGEYVNQRDGQSLAKIRSEEFEAGRILGIGQSSCGRLVPGRTFDLYDHPYWDLNDSYLLVSVTHQGRQSGNVGNGRSELAPDLTANRSSSSWLYHGGQVSRDVASNAMVQGGDPMDSVSTPNQMDDPAHSDSSEAINHSYECRFECMPATVMYRPPRITPWPEMRGTQTARVVGPPNEEIHTDVFGRVKVQFNWDCEGKFEEKASCWIRVSQGMAGGSYGIMFLPRVGQEVVVDFLEGDPDKPLIVGRVYNADHMPPYPLPDEKTKSVIKTNTVGGDGTNEIRFEDLAGSEQVLIHAARDLHFRVRNDRVENVEGGHHLTVDAHKHESIKKSKTSEVGLDVTEKIGGCKSLAVTGDVGVETKGNMSTASVGSYYVNADGEMVLESATAITLKVGGNFIKIDESGIVELGKMIKLNSGGSAGNGTPVELKKVRKPMTADMAIPGMDTRYSKDAEKMEPVEFKEEKKETSWIEIELVDEAGQPVPYETYEIVEPDGETTKTGSLDENGQAYVAVSDPGTCKITFPRLDAAAWERN